MTRTILTALLVCGALAGCNTQQSYGGYASQYACLYARYYSPPTPTSTLPSTGSATYEGVALLNTDRVSMAGATSLTANFASQTVSGSIHDIEADGGGSLSGTINVGTGIIGPVAGVQRFTAPLSGTLSGAPLAATGPISVNGAMTGTFLQSDYRAIAGVVTGTYSSGGGSGGLSGLAIAER